MAAVHVPRLARLHDERRHTGLTKCPPRVPFRCMEFRAGRDGATALFLLCSMTGVSRRTCGRAYRFPRGAPARRGAGVHHAADRTQRHQPELRRDRPGDAAARQRDPRGAIRSSSSASARSSGRSDHVAASAFAMRLFAEPWSPATSPIKAGT